MDIRQFQENMQKCSADTEQIYNRLGVCFPSLLSITNEKETSSLPSLKALFGNLSSGFSSYQQEEKNFFSEYNTRNATLFEDLNARMSALDRINERVSSIRTDSEELEIISLNAMVISIKSGEKGRAFSCITENLKLLSARMIAISNELLREESSLVEKNSSQKEAFSALLGVQKSVITVSSDGGNNDIMPVIASAEAALDRMMENAAKVAAPIREAMSGIQLQDIIRQSIDQITLALANMSPIAGTESDEDRLDQLSLDIELLEICIKITGDIKTNLELSIRSFSGNWTHVHEILDSVEQERREFISSYLDRNSKALSALPLLLDQMIGGFSDYIRHITIYQRGQKTMVDDSISIVSAVKHLRVLFDNIQPIIARLQHVRITQQIEVAKNSAISSVQDTVNNMSDLIVQTEQLVQDTRKELEVFISGIETLTTAFTESAAKDNRALERIKQDKTGFFKQMQNYQEELASEVTHLQVYPDSFQAMCAEIDGHLSNLKMTLATIDETEHQLEKTAAIYRSDRVSCLAHAGLESWTIRNDRFRDLVERFTITSHKEAAGKIGGFNVESSKFDSIESGDVTLFF